MEGGSSQPSSSAGGMGSQGASQTGAARRRPIRIGDGASPSPLAVQRLPTVRGSRPPLFQGQGNFVWEGTVEVDGEGKKCRWCDATLARSLEKKSTEWLKHLLCCSALQQAARGGTEDQNEALLFLEKVVQRSKSLRELIKFPKYETAITTTCESFGFDTGTTQTTLSAPKDVCDAARSADILNAIGKFFLYNAISFRLVSTSEFEHLLHVLNSAYRGCPSRKQLAASVSEHFHCLEVQVNDITKHWSDTGHLCVGLDGWTNTAGHSLTIFSSINNTTNSSLFSGCITMHGQDQSARGMVHAVKQFSQKNPFLNLTSIISDNCSTMRKMRRLLMENSGIMGHSCFYHVSDLVAGHWLKSSDRIRSVVSKVNEIAVFCKQRGWIRAEAEKLNRLDPAQYHFKAISITGATRQLTFAKVLRRMMNNRGTLASVLHSPEGRRRSKQGDAETRRKFKEFSDVLREDFMCECAEGHFHFWKCARVIMYILTCMETINRMMERSNLTRSDVLLHFWQFREHLRNLGSHIDLQNFKNERDLAVKCLQESLLKFKWNHDSLALFLDPRRADYDNVYATDRERAVGEKADGKVQTPQNKRDSEDLGRYTEQLVEVANWLVSHQKFSGGKYGPHTQWNNDLVNAIRVQSQYYEQAIRTHHCDNPASPMIHALCGIHPADWWAGAGAYHYPALAPIASILFSATVSSSAVERINSQFKHVHSSTRNRLGAKRAFMAAYIYVNSRALKEAKQQPASS